MAVEEQDENTRMEGLLISLSNKQSDNNTQSKNNLIQSHNSVHISFAEMLDYIDKILKQEKLESIRPPLDAFRKMAPKYFTQFELSLLQEIEKQQKLVEQADEVINQIKSRQTDIQNPEIIEAMKTANDLLNTASASAGKEREELENDFPTLMQSALDKLKDEWQRLDAIVAATETMTKDTEFIQTLNIVVEVAAYTVGTVAERIVVVPGNTFSLYFFSYLDDFAILTVPIYSVQAPWEWSIFWHELAGYQARKLKQNATIEDIREKLNDFHDHYQKITNEDERSRLLREATWNNKFSQNYLSDLFSKPKLVLNDLGGFEHQFELMLADLPKKDKDKSRFDIYEKLKEDGWCVEWLKELFEDAWSVLTIRDKFMAYFGDILERHVAFDGCHPPREIRLRIANLLLNIAYPSIEDNSGITDTNAHLELSEEEENFAKIVAEQLLKFVSLLMAAHYKFDTPENAVSQSSEERPYTATELRQILDYLLEVVRSMISNSITEWSEKVTSTLDKHDTTNQSTYATPNFSDEALQQFMELLKRSKNPIPNYEKMLDKKGYKELLTLSFYDVDYGLPVTVFRFIYGGIGYSITQPNLNSSTGTYIFTSEVTGGQKILTLGNTSYWTTGSNITRMKTNNLII